MKSIEELIEEIVLAIFSDEQLSKMLALKGGAALHLLEHIDARLSTDIDFSSRQEITNAGDFFQLVEKVLQKAFQKEYEVIDFKYQRKPKTRRGQPDWWAGWACGFKLSAVAHKERDSQWKSRAAFIPSGATSNVFDIEISEHECCTDLQVKIKKGIKINGYSRALLVVEKIRALCQQHSSYPYTSSKNRARDFVDIYHLTQDLDDNFLAECQVLLAPVFKAKEVPLSLLEAFNDDAFLEIHKRGFQQVVDTLRISSHPFETYVEHLRYILMRLKESA